MTHKKYRIKKKEIYIKYELDGYVEFGNGSHNFIVCANQPPFANYRVGDEIEVDLTSAKFMSSQNYHQGIVKKVSQSLTGGYSGSYGLQLDTYDLQHDEYNESHESQPEQQQLLIQKQKTLHQV